MHPDDIHAHLTRLHAERLHVRDAGLDTCTTYMRDLEQEISEYRAAYVSAMVTEVAIARAEISGRLEG